MSDAALTLKRRKADAKYYSKHKDNDAYKARKAAEQRERRRRERVDKNLMLDELAAADERARRAAREFAALQRHEADGDADDDSESEASSSSVESGDDSIDDFDDMPDDDDDDEPDERTGWSEARTRELFTRAAVSDRRMREDTGLTRDLFDEAFALVWPFLEATRYDGGERVNKVRNAPLVCDRLQFYITVNWLREVSKLDSIESFPFFFLFFLADSFIGSRAKNGRSTSSTARSQSFLVCPSGMW